MLVHNLLQYSILGEKVTTLLDEHHPSGIHRVVRDGMNRHGRTVVSRVYFYRVTAAGVDVIQKIALVE